jgi:uncharacterized membrane protein (UPF0127 family)
MGHFLSLLVARPNSSFRLENDTTGLLMASSLETAFDSAARRRGLLKRDRLDVGTAIVLAPCAAIHTLFMRFPIDVVFVARDGTVTKVCPKVKPWRTAIAFGAFAAIELAAGGADESRTTVGDRLRLEVLP